MTVDKVGSDSADVTATVRKCFDRWRETSDGITNVVDAVQSECGRLLGRCSVGDRQAICTVTETTSPKRQLRSRWYNTYDVLRIDCFQASWM